MRTHTGVVPSPTPRIAMSDEQRRVVFMAASLLLDYPDERWQSIVDAVSLQVNALPKKTKQHFVHFLTAAQVMGRRGMEQHYVECFDQRRRCSLFLSYYAVGDTRQRGAAILAFQESLETLGFFLDREELPDHLCVVLEVAAKAESSAHHVATDMLAAHRDGIEVLRVALEHLDSPYSGLVAAVCSALPDIDEDTRHNFVDLIRSGPPAELIGIESPLPFPTASNV
ncbi:Nitrate reductase subunit delta [Corynebacterium pseudotuberculosis]|uniref:nitrate reductase molybdenum cofactor assembly chaperone n=1 Tax=Corynebacterium pseudotuberculosis TaxID=1719 RepID=UPI00065DE016|nr:nitrate reductase molybdenum cofactor assembly chaperone [Corynebacterium pseudotuberculosis]AKP08034.1 Nitrate reductase subunit delta [Corynebacterium pseudotuberculosis]